MWRKVVPRWKDHHRPIPELPWASQISNISSQNEASRLHEREKKLAWPEW